MRGLSLALSLAISVAASAASAQGRPSTVTLTCARAAALVVQQKAIVLGTGGATYDRFVSGADGCLVGEVTEPAFAPSADNPQCFVGYRCRARGFNTR